MKKVTNQTELDQAVSAGDSRIEVIGDWNKVIIREGVKIDVLKISGTVTGSVDISGTVTGSVYIYGTVTGNVYISGTAKVGNVDIYGTVTGNVYISGTVTGNVYISGTATGNVYISGTVTGNVDISGTAKVGSVDISGTVKVGKGFESIRSDYFSILKNAIPEIPALISALKKGRINGSVYEGDCRCLVGTLEAARGTGANTVIERDSSRPAEKWFLAIPEGHTPKKNAFARLAVEWAEEFLELQKNK